MANELRAYTEQILTSLNAPQDTEVRTTSRYFPTGRLPSKEKIAEARKDINNYTPVTSEARIIDYGTFTESVKILGRRTKPVQAPYVRNPENDEGMA